VASLGIKDGDANCMQHSSVVGVGDESTGQVWARWFVLETEFFDEKQNEKTNEKWKVPKKHTSVTHR